MLNVSKGILVRTMVVIDHSLWQRICYVGKIGSVNRLRDVRVIARYRGFFRVN